SVSFHPKVPNWLKMDVDIGTLDPSGLNLLFWEDLVMHDCAPSWLLNQDTMMLAGATSIYNMIPYRCLPGDSTRLAASQSFVSDWESSTYSASNGNSLASSGDYWWRHEDHGGPRSYTWNRLDYLVLRGLFNLDPSGWQNAPAHFGVSFDLTIPHVG